MQLKFKDNDWANESMMRASAPSMDKWHVIFHEIEIIVRTKHYFIFTFFSGNNLPEGDVLVGRSINFQKTGR